MVDFEFWGLEIPPRNCVPYLTLRETPEDRMQKRSTPANLFQEHCPGG